MGLALLECFATLEEAETCKKGLSYDVGEENVYIYFEPKISGKDTPYTVSID